MSNIKKILLYSGIAITVLVVAAIAFISPIAKYLIEKYDKQYTGRQITIDWSYVNPWTGYLYISNLKIYESESDSIFLAADGLTANIAMNKLLAQNYEISELTLEKAKGLVYQNHDYFNYNDLIDKFYSSADTLKKSMPIHLSILNIKVNNSELHYKEEVTPINYFLKNVNLECEGIRWNVDTIPFKFSFLSGNGTGEMKGKFTVNSKNNDYTLSVVAEHFDLNIIGQYVKGFSNYGSFKAFLDADLKSSGNFNDEEDVTHTGNIKISDFHFGKTPNEDYAAFDNLTLAIKELSPKYHKYQFDSISLSRPYFKYETYDAMDNLQTMFGEKGANVKAANSEGAKFNLVIEIADYVKVLAKNFLRSNYRVDRLGIFKGIIKYNDYSLSEKFAVGLNPFTFTADSVDKTHKRVYFDMASGIKPYGHLAVGMSINPNDSTDFDITYKFQKLPASIFNPYFIKYTSFPLDRGSIDIKGSWRVRKDQIKSTNHLTIIDPRVGTRFKNKNSSWLPMRLIMFFVRERGNVIDYEVPITGNLKNPKFGLRDVIFDILENIFVKPATTPYRVKVKRVETEIEKSLSLKWEMRSSVLTLNQINFIQRMAHFLKMNPKVTIAINPQRYTLKEKEYIMFYEAKKKFYLKFRGKNIARFDKHDSTKIEQMSVKDPQFTKYLNDQTHDPLLFTVQDKCARLLSSNYIDQKYKELNRKRLAVVMLYFKEKGSEKQVKVKKGKSVIPFNGYSFYKIEYDGNFPPYLLRAFRQMCELNREAPREKFRRMINY